ncbi:Cellular retinoic acid-binding protein 1 [Acipenser ruthenus]|uniref:Cellular retinoic acid-binding protein 1 n=1 Tax=Acipenser ruthenus TaxID=7906 RepID=A0A662YN96_ACIRT|nr:Cellular retinoic acid-binding protein 1 [Acipenser ruthenus]
MPNFAGTWKMKSSENFDELLKALGVNAMLRKVAGAAASKPHVEIRQNGEQFYIKTSTTVRTTEINFQIGVEFEEETVDGRKCRSLATWETENKIYCKQTLIDGDGPKTYWTRELTGDELILILKMPLTPTALPVLVSAVVIFPGVGALLAGHRVLFGCMFAGYRFVHCEGYRSIRDYRSIYI